VANGGYNHGRFEWGPRLWWKSSVVCTQAHGMHL